MYTKGSCKGSVKDSSRILGLGDLKAEFTSTSRVPCLEGVGIIAVRQIGSRILCVRGFPIRFTSRYLALNPKA